MLKLQWFLTILQTPTLGKTPTPTPSPTPDEYLPSITGAIDNFVSGTSGRELSWMIVSLVLIFVLRMVAALDIRKEEGGSGAVVVWILGLMCWFTVAYLIGYHKMIEVQPPAVASFGILLLLIAAVLALISTLLLHNKTRNWRDILSGSIIGIIGFAMLITFVKGVQVFSYAMFFGCILGIVLGGIYFSYKRMSAVERGESTDGPKEAKTKVI